MRKLLVCGLLAATAAWAVPTELVQGVLATTASATVATFTLSAPPGPVSGQYAVIGTEASLIRAVSSFTLTVTRAAAGTTGANHVRGLTVYIGPLNAFVASDPSGACVRNNLPYVPVVSLASGAAYDCINSVYTLVAGGNTPLGITNGGTGTNGTTPSALTALGCVSVAADGLSLKTLTATPCGAGGSSAFSSLTSGTNTAAAMVVSTGASLTTGGSGTINANRVGTLTGVLQATSGTPSVVTGTGTDCVLVNGSSGSCGTATTGLVLTGVSTTAGSVSSGAFFSNNTTYNITGFDWQRVSWAVTAVSGTTDITITTSTSVTPWMHTGDSFYLQGFTGGCAPLNGLQTNVNVTAAAVFHVAVALPSCTYSGSGGTVGIPPTGANGQIQVCGEPNGTIQFWVDPNLGMTLSNTGAAAATVLQSAGNPTNCVTYRGTINIVNGLVSSITASTAILGSANVTAGDGLSDACSNASTKCLKLDSSVCRTTIGCAILSTFDATASTSSKPAKTVTSDPGTCAVGEVFFNSTSNLYKGCAPANTLTTFGGSSGTPLTSWWPFGIGLDAIASVSEAVVSANRVQFAAFQVPSPGLTFTKIAVFVNTGTGNITAGIYDSTCTLITNGNASTSVAPGGIAVALTMPATITLTPGKYFFGWTSNQTADVLYRSPTNYVLSFEVGLSGTGLDYFYGSNTGSGANPNVLPSTCGTRTANLGVNGPPAVWLR